MSIKHREQVFRVVITGISFLCLQTAFGQGRAVTGTIRDEDTGRPIRNASVFFDRTLNGVFTDSVGNFTLYPQGATQLPVFVSVVGYASKTITEYPSDRKITIELKPTAYNLDAVTVLANDGMSRAEKLKIFKREFVGSSPSAKSSVILNDADLHFTYSSKTRILQATSDKPIMIQNKALGYTLNFLVANFTYTGEQTTFYGSQFFREDGSMSDPEKVKKSRRTAYLGSQMHFIRSLWNNKLAENGFEAIRYVLESSSAPINRDITATTRDNPNQYVARDIRQLGYDSLVVSNGNQKYLRFTGYVKVTYRSQVSIMTGSGKNVLIDKNGYQEPEGIVWSGNIGIQRAGDLLPLEYEDVAPGRDKKEDNNNISTGYTASVLMDTLHSRMPLEKLYIQLDKPYYSSGDTLRMKAYLLDAGEGKGSTKSGIVYVELANDSNKVFLRRMLPVGFGLGTGNIILSKGDIPEGSYTLRAYTNLMRNFGEETAYRKNLYISSPTVQSWLVNSKSTLSKQSGKDNLRLALQLNQLNRQALTNRELEVRVMDGDRVIQRDKVQTDMSGKMDVNFNLPESSARNLSMVVTDPKSPAHKVTIPVAANRPENIDLQFMPEGGSLVAGVPSRVGFKAIGEDGNGVEVSGKIYNSSNEEVASFASSYKGMGSFELKPVGTSTHTARVILNATPKSFPLPTIKTSGSVLRITNPLRSDSVKATVSISTSVSTASTAVYHLVGQSGGKVLYEEEIPVKGNTFITKSIGKDLFPTGVVRFTLLNAEKQPLNERVTFIDHDDQLEISLKPVSSSYKTRDSVSVAIEVKDNEKDSEGKPVQGSFSLAVTDDSQVHADSSGTNILTQMLLTSGLKGTIEAPAHYLQKTLQAAADLDHLLLSQGWIGYDWKEVFTPPASPAYAAEQEFVVKGKVTNVSKSDAETAVVLMSSRPAFAKTGVAEKDGSFTFTGFPVNDSLSFFVQAKNPKVKSLEIERVDFKPAVFKPESRRLTPWYVNSDSTLLRQVSLKATEQAKINANGANLLKEVIITGRKIVPGSRNLNGPGESDQTLDEKDMAAGSKSTLLDVIQEKIKGFNVGLFPTRDPPASGLTAVRSIGEVPGDVEIMNGGTMSTPFKKKQSYRINDKEIHLVIDGIDVEQFYIPAPEAIGGGFIGVDVPPGGMDPVIGRIASDYVTLRNAASPTDRQEFIRSYLKYIKASDVKGVEVMYNPKYNTKYKSLFSSTILGNLSMITTDFVYLEVTTYSGNGAFMQQTPGIAIYRPVPFVNNTAFYKPKYTSKPNPMPDLRSTIHWAPDVLTDNNGKATVSFYSADRPGTYSLIMEGSNMNGNVGMKTGTIQIK